MRAASPLSRSVAPLAGILLLAVGLRFGSIAHGWPRNYVPDNTVVRAALSLGAGTEPWRGEALPTQYPYLLPYALYATYGVFYVGGHLAGAFPSVASFESFAFDRPEVFFLLARLLVAACGCLLVVFVFRIAESLAGRAAATAAALFCATSLILVQMSQQARPHVVAAFLIVASLRAAQRSRDGGGRTLLWSWVLAAASASASPYGLLALGIPAVATVTGSSGAARRRRLALGVLAAGLVIVACYPRLLLAPGTAFGYDPESGLVRYYDGLLVRWRFFNGGGFGKLARWAALYEPTLLLAAVGGVATIWRRRERLAEWSLVAVYPVAFLLVYGSYEVVHPRYLVSLVPFLALPAGAWIGDLARRLSVSRHPETATRGRPLLVALVLLIAFGWPLVQAVRLDLLLTRADSRELARSWVLAHLSPRSTIGLEAHGIELEPDAASLRHAVGLGGERLGVRDRRRLELGAPGWSIRRLWQLAGYRSAALSDTVERLGLDYVVAVRRGEERRDDRFYLGLEARGERLATFDPRLPGTGPVETDLPTELDDPITGLWRVERPGPIVEVFAVAP